MTSRYDLIKTHYWDWTTDPRTTTGGRANLFTTDFMGTDQGFVTNPFPANFSTGVTGSGGIERDFQAGAPSAANASSFGFPANTFRLDANLLAAGGGTQATQYQNFRTAEENMHNYIHTYAGGTLGGDFHDAFCDPLAFVLHSEVDRMFARWQRDPAQVNRLVPFDDVTNNDVYGNERNTVGTSLGTCFGGVPMEGIQDFLEPWSTGSGDFGTVAPWDGGSLCQIAKNSTHPSVVSPPIYDTPGVPIPGIPAGQSIIIQIPWHVPNPDYYSCFTGNNKKNIFA